MLTIIFHTIKNYLNQRYSIKGMKRGRPVGSTIRQNIVEILYFLKKAYGYEIYKAYRDLFPKITLRVVYYHLRKGVATHEFVVDKVIQEKGNYSWGGSAEKIYYSLGKEAKPRVENKVKDYFEKKKPRKKKSGKK